jgi:hypothetical protein
MPLIRFAAAKPDDGFSGSRFNSGCYVHPMSELSMTNSKLRFEVGFGGLRRSSPCKCDRPSPYRGFSRRHNQAQSEQHVETQDYQHAPQALHGFFTSTPQQSVLATVAPGILLIMQDTKEAS